MPKLRLVVMLVTLAAAAAYAADPVAGTWKGVMSVSVSGSPSDAGGEDRAEVAVVLALHRDGGKVTGTLTAAGKESVPIERGAFEGNRVTFEINDNPSVKFEGILSGDALKFKVEGKVKVTEGEHQFKGTMDLKRTE